VNYKSRQGHLGFDGLFQLVGVNLTAFGIDHYCDRVPAIKPLKSNSLDATAALRWRRSNLHLCQALCNAWQISKAQAKHSTASATSCPHRDIVVQSAPFLLIQLFYPLDNLSMPILITMAHIEAGNIHAIGRKSRQHL
jgi:hypothetical protein